MECILYDSEDNQFPIEVNNFLDDVDDHTIEFVFTEDDPWPVIGGVFQEQLQKQMDTTNDSYMFDLTIDGFHYYDCFITCMDYQDLDHSNDTFQVVILIAFTRRLPRLPKGL